MLIGKWSRAVVVANDNTNTQHNAHVTVTDSACMLP